MAESSDRLSEQSLPHINSPPELQFADPRAGLHYSTSWMKSNQMPPQTTTLVEQPVFSQPQYITGVQTHSLDMATHMQQVSQSQLVAQSNQPQLVALSTQPHLVAQSTSAQMAVQYAINQDVHYLQRYQEAIQSTRMTDDDLIHRQEAEVVKHLYSEQIRAWSNTTEHTEGTEELQPVNLTQQNSQLIASSPNGSSQGSQSSEMLISHNTHRSTPEIQDRHLETYYADKSQNVAIEVNNEKAVNINLPGTVPRETPVSVPHEAAVSVPHVTPVDKTVPDADGKMNEILVAQRNELHELRNYGLLDQVKVLADVAQEEIEKLAKQQTVNDSEPQNENPVQETTVELVEEEPTNTNELSNEKYQHHDKIELTNLLNQSLIDFCHNNLYFIEFVHITGRFSFNVDNRQTMQLNVSQMATPQAFSDETKITKRNRSKLKAIPKKPSKKIITSTPTTTPRKRGRPRKNPLPVDPTPPKKRHIKIEINMPEPDDMKPSTSGSTGRRAAVKARQRLTKIVTHEERLEYNDVSDSDAEAVDEDYGEDKDYVPDVAPVRVGRRRAPSRRSVGSIDYSNDGSSFTHIKEEVDESEEENDEDEEDSLDAVSSGNNKSRDEDSFLSDAEEVENEEVENDQFSCSLCTKKFASELSLKNHVDSHKVFKCSDKECQSLVYYMRGDIRKHFRDVHGKQAKQLYRCKTCRQEFLTATELKEHVHDTNNIICNVCGENFTDKSLLRQHKASAHLEKSCHICGKNFVSRAAFHRHFKRHKDKAAGKKKCDECDKEFTASSSLFHHKKAVHRGVKPYQCDECGMSFNFNNSLKLHKLKHSGVRPFQCNVCDKSYLTASHLKNHVQALHTDNKQYACPICDKRFPYDNSLKLHMRLHTGDRPYMCHLCSKTFVSKSALKVHEASHVDSKNYKCDICNKTYKTEALMRVHRRRHTSDGSRYMCDICGNTYMYKSNLAVHYEVHGDNKKHQCKICGKMFKTYPTLYSHYLVHSDKNPYICTQCGKSFKTKERLKAHAIRHSGLKPYVCESCGSSFPDKGGLSKHKKTVHAEVARFACPVCGKPCNRADNLRVHMKVHGDPALLKLSLEELAATSKMPNPSGKCRTSSTSSDVSPNKNMLTDNDTSQGSILHTMEAAQPDHRMQRTEAYHQQEDPNPTQHSEHMVNRMPNPQDVMSQMGTPPFIGMPHWGTDGALHYQNLLLSQGYPTAGMIQAQVQHASQVPHTEAHNTTSYQTPGQGSSHQY